MSLYPSLALVAVFLYLNRFLQGKTGRRTEKIGRGGGAVAFRLQQMCHGGVTSLSFSRSGEM